MTSVRSPSQIRSHERIIAEGIVNVATELRLADVSTLMAMIINQQEAHIADLVNSSTELYFRAGTLRYALVSDFELQWDHAPVIRVDMEFHNSSVTAFFRVIMSCSRAAVQLLDILFDERGLDFHTQSCRLQSAIDDARLA